MLSPEVRAEVLVVLRRARQRLTPVEAWTQNDFAQQRDGLACAAASPLAVCWCLESAVVLASEGMAPQRQVDAINELCMTVGVRNTGLTLVGWNDAAGRSHHEILGALDTTIARLAREAGEAA